MGQTGILPGGQASTVTALFPFGLQLTDHEDHSRNSTFQEECLSRLSTIPALPESIYHLPPPSHAALSL
jgi:hypothetical protein